MKIIKSWLLFLTTFALLLVACDSEENKTSGNTPPPSPNITSRMETPRVKTDGSTVLISHSAKVRGRDVLTYSVEFDRNKMHSRWVAFRFDATTRLKETSRADVPFTDDTELPIACRIGGNSFGKGYSRGHLCASADRLYATDDRNNTANKQTFYMSNISPQKGNFNAPYWSTLEGVVRDVVRNKNFTDDDTLYVVKGGTINDHQIIEWINRPNGTKVPVPKFFYMALLKVHKGVYTSIAFWVEHKDYGYDSNSTVPKKIMKQHAISVNQLEAKTGIDFFPNLPDAAEEKIEDCCLPADWGL